MIELLMVVVGVLVMSAVCSGTEASLFAVSLIRAQQLAVTKTKSATNLLAIRQNMDSPIAALVFANNAANILGSMLIANMAAKQFDSFWLGVFSGALTLSIIIFSEIIPKTLGEMYSDKIALAVSTPVLWFTWLMTPLIFIVNKIVYPITKHRKHISVGETEIQFIANMSQTNGTIEAVESNMIHQVFKMNDMAAKQIMTPRVNMSYFYGSDSIGEIEQEIYSLEHSRIIVIDETPDDVLGVVHKTELLSHLAMSHRDMLIKDLMVPVHRFSESTKADQMLKFFQSTKLHLAVVEDEFGGVSGVVTLEDVLEIIVGEIMDETDSTADLRIV